MILQFTVSNMCSFNEPQTLDLRAVKTCKERRDEASVVLFPGTRFADDRALKTIAIYGANASGKTNLLRAMHFFMTMVRQSSVGGQVGNLIPVQPFLYADRGNMPGPSGFEMVFSIGNMVYRYGFKATYKDVVEEWLFVKDMVMDRVVEKELFVRFRDGEKDDIRVSKSFSGVDNTIITKTRRNALFLSTCANLAVPEATKIIGLVFANMAMYSAEWMRYDYTAEFCKSASGAKRVLDFLQKTDPTIGLIDVESVPDETRMGLTTWHRSQSRFNVKIRPKRIGGGVYDDGLALDAIASSGTQRAFVLAGPMLDILDKGGLLVVDELDCRLHPILVRQIIRLFNSKASNPNNAQLVFNTHDTNLLNDKVYDSQKGKYEPLLRRDEIYFTERNQSFATRLYSLAEFKKEGKSVRNDASYEKDYLQGLYGAIPFIGGL